MDWFAALARKGSGDPKPSAASICACALNEQSKECKDAQDEASTDPYFHTGTLHSYMDEKCLPMLCSRGGEVCPGLQNGICGAACHQWICSSNQKCLHYQRLRGMMGWSVERNINVTCSCPGFELEGLACGNTCTDVDGECYPFSHCYGLTGAPATNGRCDGMPFQCNLGCMGCTAAEPTDPCADVHCGQFGGCWDGKCQCDPGYSGDYVCVRDEPSDDHRNASCACIDDWNGDACMRALRYDDEAREAWRSGDDNYFTDRCHPASCAGAKVCEDLASGTCSSECSA